MAPSEHIEWFDDNITWFESLTVEDLPVAVPACPGWDVSYVVNHLAFGLGLAYPYALTTAVDASGDEAFADVPWPSNYPAGSEALVAFSEHMRACQSAFRDIDPATRCWTYAGPGVAAFWVRRAAIETTLHRMDVVAALAIDDEPLANDRASDAVAETIDFALPLAATLTGGSPPAMAIEAGPEPSTTLGSGVPASHLSGSAEAVLSALWGRGTEGVAIGGDEEVAKAWLGLIAEAFAGR